MLAKQTLVLMVITFLGGCFGNDGQTSGKPSGFLNNDADIFMNLKKHLGLTPVEKGGGGRCLFHSLREQISKAELVAVKALFDVAIGTQIDGYDALSEVDKADLLRRIAIYNEKDFLETKNNIANTFDALTPEDQAWVLEMAKDYHEEFRGREKTRDWFNEHKISAAGRQIMWQYVIDNRNAYWAKTSCDTNWAGSAEAIVFARILNRPLNMYGMDKASSLDGAKLDSNGVVVPYLTYDYGYKGSPLLVYQTGGGGHYQMLLKAN